MKKLLSILLLPVLLLSCKKQNDNSAFIVTGVDGVQHNLRVDPSDPNSTAPGLSIIYFIPPQPVQLPAYYSITLTLNGGNGVNKIFNLSLPSLQMQNTSYDSTYFFNVFNEIVIEGVTYYSNGVNINNVSISLAPHLWVGEQDNSIASGSIDLSLNAVSSQDTNGNITRLTDLHKKIYIKGSFKNIFANQ